VDDAPLETPSLDNANPKSKKKKKGRKPNKKRNYPDATELAHLKGEAEEMRNTMICKICLESLVNRVFLPCGHLVCCEICSEKLKGCPICRSQIIAVVIVQTDC
jgi:hypothetical protein